jgi:CheY-like chemotaxis protein
MQSPDSSVYANIRLDGLRIVIVDDEADARRVVGRILQDAGAVVAPAGSVNEALQAIEKIRPHVLISDIAMPDRDGYDLIREVRAKGHTAQSLPSVALTAFAAKGLRPKCSFGGISKCMWRNRLTRTTFSRSSVAWRAVPEILA